MSTDVHTYIYTDTNIHIHKYIHVYACNIQTKHPYITWQNEAEHTWKHTFNCIYIKPLRPDPTWFLCKYNTLIRTPSEIISLLQYSSHLMNYLQYFELQNLQWYILMTNFIFCNYAHFLGRNQETTWFRVLKLIFVKRFIQRIPLNHYMRFNLNSLKVWEH